MKKIQLSLLVGLLAFSLSTVAQARSLGLNFAATDPNAADSSLLAAEVAGVVPQANWNNLEGATGTNVGSLELDNGGASTATVTWSSPNTWRSAANSMFPAGPNRKLTNGYLDSTDMAAGGAMVTVNNIDAALRSPAYDVYVYFVSDSGANRGGGYTLTPQGGAPIVKYGSTLAMPTGFVEDPGTDLDLTLDGTHLRFRGVTGSSFSIATNAALTTPNGFRAPINAIQIVGIPEPSTALLACGAAALLAALGWRRRN